MADESYYLRKRGRVSGPHSTQELSKMAALRQLARFDDLSADNRTWFSAGEHDLLFRRTPPAAEAQPLPPPNQADDQFASQASEMQPSGIDWDSPFDDKVPTPAAQGPPAPPQAPADNTYALGDEAIEQPEAQWPPEYVKKPTTSLERVSLGDVLKAPFSAAVTAEAVALVIWGGTWLLILGLALLPLPVLQALNSVLGFIGSLAWLALALRASSWFFGRYFAITQQFETASLLPEAPRNGVADLGYALAVTALSLVPFLAAGISDLAIVIASAWAVLYFPIGLAVAGAYRSLNPLIVLKVFQGCFLTYILIVVCAAPFVVAVILAASMCLGVISAYFSPDVAGIIAPVVVAIIPQYVLAAEFAMLGMMLRKWRSDAGLVDRDVLNE